MSDRLCAWDLLNDPFLQTDDYVYDFSTLNGQRDYAETYPILTPPLMSTYHSTRSSLVNGYPGYLGYEQEHDLDCSSVLEYVGNEIDLFPGGEDHHLENVDITVKGRRGEDDGIFLKLRIADKEGQFEFFCSNRSYVVAFYKNCLHLNHVYI